MIPEQDNALKFRLRFEKKGPIRFISHLDLTRAFHRAFHRALIPLKYSEGFSPHPKFAFALPLSVGTESQAEMADFTLKAGFEITPEALKETLQAQMPAGILLTKILPQGEKFSEIAFASYTVFLPRIGEDKIPALKEALKGDLILCKKNKKGKWVEKEISGGIRTLEISPKDGGVQMNMVLCASGENYLKPESVLEVIKGRLPQEDFSEREILRCEIYRSDMTLFE